MRSFNFSGTRVLVFRRRKDDGALLLDGRRSWSETGAAAGGRGSEGVGVSEGGERSGLVCWSFVAGGVCAGLNWLVMQRIRRWGNVLRARGGSFRSWTGLIHRLFYQSVVIC